MLMISSITAASAICYCKFLYTSLSGRSRKGLPGERLAAISLFVKILSVELAKQCLPPAFEAQLAKQMFGFPGNI